MKFKSHLDFEQVAQLIKVRVHNKANHTDLPAVKGGLYFNTTTDILMWADGTNWHEMSDVSAFINLLVANDGITFTPGTGGNAGKTIVDVAANSDIFEFTGTAPNRVLNLKANGVVLSRLQKINKLRVLGRSEDPAGLATDSVTQVTVDTVIDTDTAAHHDSLPTTKAVRTAIQAVAGVIPTIAAGDGIDIAVSGVTNTIKVDATNKFEFTETGKKLDIAENAITNRELSESADVDANRAVTTAHIRDGAISTAKVSDQAITFGKVNTAAIITSANTGLFGITTENGDITFATSKAIVDYVDQKVGDLGNLIGGWNASSGAFPSAPGGTQTGDYWFVETAGTTADIEFTVGSTIIAKQDDASTSNPAHWIMLISKTGAATTTKLGLVKYATQTEVDGHAVADKVITPALLHCDTTIVGATIKQTFGSNIKRKYSADIGNGSASAIAVTHNFVTKDVHVDVYEKATNEKVMVDVACTNDNTVTVSFAAAPASNSYRVVITA
jgi:hypothetical protein